MKPLCLLILIACIATVKLSAQNNKFFIESEVRKSDQANRVYGLWFQDIENEDFHILRTNTHMNLAFTDVYTKDLKHIKSVETCNAKRFSGGIALQNNPYLLELKYKYDVHIKTYTDISFVGHRLNKASDKIGEDSTIMITPFILKENIFRGNFAISPDKSKLLLYHYTEDDELGIRGLTDEVELLVFDADLKLLWKRKVNLSPENYGKKIVVLKKFRINNQGSIGILTTIFKSENKRTYKSNTPTDIPSFFFVGRAENEFIHFKPTLPDYFFNEIDFAFDKENNIHLLGQYSTQAYMYQGGYIYMKLNATCTKVLAKTVTPYTAEFMKAAWGKNRLKYNELVDFYLTSWRIIAETNEIVFTLERRSPSAISLKYQQVIVGKLDEKGQLLWINTIYKNTQEAEKYEAFLSHYMVPKENKVYVLYNSGIYDSNKAVIVQIDEKGNMREKPLFLNRNRETILCPILTQVVGDKLLLTMQSTYFSVYNFGLLDLEAFFQD